MKVKSEKNSPRTEDKEATTPDKWWIRGTSETQEFFDVSAQTLSDWEKRGAPKEGYGKWDVKKLVEWKYKGSAGNKSPELRKVTADADWKEAKAGQEAIKLAVVEGRYIATEQVTADLKQLFTVLKRSFLAMGYNIAIELNGLDPEAALLAKKVVDDVVYNALTQIAEKGEYIRKKK